MPKANRGRGSPFYLPKPAVNKEVKNKVKYMLYYYLQTKHTCYILKRTRDLLVK